MNGNKVLGLVFANLHEEALGNLTELRTMGSVPFLSRYRLVDFPLSNLVESGVTKVGIVTNSNFQSLMDHVGTGKPWDLSRKNDGLYILPPFNNVNSSTMWGNRIDAIYGNLGFLRQSNQSYVLLTDCNTIMSLDCQKLFDAHEASGADITIVGVRGAIPKNNGSVLVFDKVDENGRVTEMSLDPETDGEVLYSSNVVLMKKYLLEDIITNAHSKNEISFQRSAFMSNIEKLQVNVFEPQNSFVGTIDSLESYYNISMSLLDKDEKKKLFNSELPIYTKERDDMPAFYGIDSKATNSLVADGCSIEGEVSGCILCKGVKIAKGAVVKDSILMQDTVIGENAKINCVIADKNVVIKGNVELSGTKSFPICLGKNARV